MSTDQQDLPKPSCNRRTIILAGVACVLGVIAVVHTYYPDTRPKVVPVADAECKLIEPKETAVLATLDEPIPDGRNAVWCASFPIAWKKLQDGTPIELDGSPAIAERLNAAPNPTSDCPADALFTHVGGLDEETKETIREETIAQFGSEPAEWLDELPDMSDGTNIYVRLEVGIPFDPPYLVLPRGGRFVPGDGPPTQVEAFGFDMEAALVGLPADVWSRAGVLFYEGDDEDYEAESFYAVDLQFDSAPSQIVLACVPRGETLEATYNDVQRRMKNATDSGRFPHAVEPMDYLTVPSMNWRIVHHYSELEGKTIRSGSYAGQPILQAIEDTRLRLGHDGVKLRSESDIAVGCVPRCYDFTRPFLLYMKQRDSDRPYFVMWVENAELLKPLE